VKQSASPAFLFLAFMPRRLLLPRTKRAARLGQSNHPASHRSHCHQLGQQGPLRPSAPQLADALGDKVSVGNQLGRLFVKQQVIFAKMGASYVPMKILRLLI
jgi:hypothetical protein